MRFLKFFNNLKEFFTKFKIPTLLGIAILTIGIVGGIFVVLGEQTFITKASPDQMPQNITFSNIEDINASISFQTASKVASFITFGENSSEEQSVLDDRDTVKPMARTFHHITLKNLKPETTYKFKITSGKYKSAEINLTTAKIPTSQNGLQPVIGFVIKNDNTPLGDGLAYLSMPEGYTQSTIIKFYGNFLIPLSLIRKQDLSEVLNPQQETVAKIKIISDEGEANAVFRLNQINRLIGPIKLGQNLDLSSEENIPSVEVEQVPDNDQKKFDLNNDNFINTSDYAIVLKNFGKNSQDKRADFNKDGVVDQLDLDMISKFFIKQVDK